MVVNRGGRLYVAGPGEENTLITQAVGDVAVTVGVSTNAGVNGQTGLIADNKLSMNQLIYMCRVPNAPGYAAEALRHACLLRHRVAQAAGKMVLGSRTRARLAPPFPSAEYSL